MIKKNKGITLISLVVSVILLAILTGIGVTIATVSIKDVTDNKLNTELGLVRQVIIERYSMAVALNRQDDTSFLIGEKIETIELPENAEEFQERILGNKKEYCRLNKEQLKQLGIRDAEHTYIVNYKTGEVYNETEKVYSNGDLLYLPPVNEGQTQETKDTTSFNDWTT